MKLLCFLIALFAAQCFSNPISAAVVPSVEQRVADLEAYIRNTAPEHSFRGETGPGHNGWMMLSAGLVLFMTLPGLALFYGGLVRRKNVLSVMAQCLGLSGIVIILWWACGYSLSFAKGTPFIGGLQWSFLRGVTADPNPDYGPWVSHNVYAMYQLMFAIITPALIVGAIAERMRFSALMLFCTLWMFLVYFPVAHMMWASDGWMNGLWNAQAGVRAIDFAGGIVVHMTSGWSALVLCLLLGRRRGFGREAIVPHSMVVTPTGAILIGLIAGVSTFFACGKLKSFFRYDDSLDTFGVHAVGGTLGSLMVGFLASSEMNPNLVTLLKPLIGHSLWLEQLKAAGLVLVLSIGVTAGLYWVIDRLIGCRVSEDIENQGLDLAEHGEDGYTR